MTHQVHDTARSGLATVVGGLLRDVRMLVHQEVALARHEVQYEIRQEPQGGPMVRDRGGAGRCRIARDGRGRCATPRRVYRVAGLSLCCDRECHVPGWGVEARGLGGGES